MSMSAIFAGSGEMALCCRSHAWEASSLGRIEDWPPGLRGQVALVMQAPYPMLLLCGDDLTQIYNDGYRELLGDKHPAALGSSVRSCWPEGWHLDAAAHQRARVGESVQVEDVQFHIVRNEVLADTRFTLVYSPVPDESSGAIGAVLVTAFETTKLAEATSKAQAATRAKGEFLAVMSHELRTPLNAIGGYAELLELGVRGPVTTEQRGDLERIQQSQRQLLEVINGVLSYAKVEAGMLHYASEDVHVDELLARCTALVAPEIRGKELELATPNCVTNLIARADGHRVQQIVLNLLTNAIKFTDRGGRVTLACSATRGNDIVVRVTDTGHGIAADDLECVFHPFVQVDAKLTRAHDGIGLGLATSRELARGMGGDLTAQSEEGAGSTFTLVLPGVQDDGDSVALQRRHGEPDRRS